MAYTKQTLQSVLSIAGAVCLMSLSACSSTPPKSAEPEAPAPVAAVPTPKPVAASETEAQKSQRILAKLADKSVYFDYDGFAVKSQYQDLIKQNEALLKSAPTLSIGLVGNTDERGSTEYNLALGQKRAEAVKRMMVILGVPEAQLEAISYGKEKPRATCHEEKCWAENRRVDFARKP